MNLTSFKALLWLGSLALGGYLGWFLYETIQRWPEVNQMLWQDEARQREALEDNVEEQPEAARRDLVDYARVSATFHDLDWNGVPPPPPVVDLPEETTPVERPPTPVADLLNVLYLQKDTRRPERSLAYVRYTDSEILRTVNAARSSGGGRGGSSGAGSSAKLKVGDALPAPYDYVRLEAVEANEAIFSFDDEEREVETVATLEFERGESGYIVRVEDGEVARVPEVDQLIPVNDTPVAFVPESTTLIGENRYAIGTDDAETWQRDYAQILTTEVRHRQWRDPQTGKYAGVQITDVVPGGIAAAHGAQQGDIIKSINGTPVTSVPEAIQYVKNNSDSTTVWEVVVESQGVERVVVYESPPEQ